MTEVNGGTARDLEPGRARGGRPPPRRSGSRRRQGPARRAPWGWRAAGADRGEGFGARSRRGSGRRGGQRCRPRREVVDARSRAGRRRRLALSSSRTTSPRCGVRSESRDRSRPNRRRSAMPSVETRDELATRASPPRPAREPTRTERSESTSDRVAGARAGEPRPRPVADFVVERAAAAARHATAVAAIEELETQVARSSDLEREVLETEARLALTRRLTDDLSRRGSSPSCSRRNERSSRSSAVACSRRSPTATTGSLPTTVSTSST